MPRHPPRLLARMLVALILAMALVGKCPAAGQDDSNELRWWDQAASGQAGYYWIKTDLPREEARKLAVHLNRLYEAFHARLGSLPQRTQEHLNVFIFASREDYQTTLAERFGINASGTGGMFFVNSEGGALAFWTGDLPERRVLHVLQHEAFHQFAYSRFGGDLPIWVNEGLAEFFGEAVLVGPTLVIGQSNERIIDAVREAVQDESHLPFSVMLSMDPQSWSMAIHRGEARLQYHQAWSMVHFLIHAEGGRYVGAFERYLRLLNNAVPSEDAFRRAFETDNIDAFEARWKAYALEAKPSAFVTALERAEFLAAGALELAQRGRTVTNLDELRDALREIEFVFTIMTHGSPATLNAIDDHVFEIPQDELATEPPMFVVEEPGRRRLNRRQRLLEEKLPTPATIRTQHLAPHNITVCWHRNEEENTLHYELIVR